MVAILNTHVRLHAWGGYKWEPGRISFDGGRWRAARIMRALLRPIGIL
jgi:hypothetical protein